jgi:short-subunit dehydrogenase
MRRLIKPAIFTAAAVGGAITAGAIVGTAATAGVIALTIRALRSKPIPHGAVVVITGGSRGLGLAIASRFAENRSHRTSPIRLVLCSRNRAELEQAQATLLARHPQLTPEDFYLVPADLAQSSECHRLVTETIAAFGRIDILVNNAGIILVGPLEDQPVEAFEQAVRINLLAAVHTTLAALPYMRVQQPLEGWTRRATIVNIASIGGKLAVPHMLPYSTAKFGLVGFSEGLHAELRHKGIRVTTVCPGLMRTGGEAHAKFVGNVEAEQKWFNFAAKTPIIATTAKHAANRIYAAVASGRAEIAITPQAWLAARFTGLCPETTQLASSLVNEYILPKAAEV